MDPSALIFVALAVAWAVYLIPKALEHHGESDRARTVERFSTRMRVLARREPVDRRTARLVGPEGADRTASRPAPEPVVPEPVAPAPLTPVQLRAHRRAAARAAKRRLRVVTLILLANVVVAALAAFAVVAWVWCAIPVAVLVAWLVACRLMVKRERAAVRTQRRLPVTPAETAPADDTTTVAATADTPFDGEAAGPIEPEADPVVEPVAEKDPDSWDPVPVTLPTYVTKAVAPRSVSTIDLDSTGVWSSGRNESDSALARDADAAHAADRQNKSSSPSSRRRASGS